MAVTLVFVHGFMGNEETFHQMPQDLVELLRGCFPDQELKWELFLYGNHFDNPNPNSFNLNPNTDIHNPNSFNPNPNTELITLTHSILTLTL